MLVTSISILVIAYVRNSIVKNIESQISITQRVFGAVLNLMSNQAVTQTISFAESGRFKAAVDTKDPETIHQLITNQQEILQSDFVIITDIKGAVITNTLDSSLNGKSVFEDFPVFQTSSSYPNICTHKMSLYQIAFTPINIAGYVSGYIIVGFSIDDDRARAIKELTLNEISFIVEGQIFSSTLNASSREALQNGIMAKGKQIADSTTFNVKLGNEKYLAHIAPLRNTSNTTTGYYVIQKSLTEAYSFLDNVTRILLFITIIALLISLVISFFVARGVTAPVESFQKMAAAISIGETDLPEFEITGRDEINDLKLSFNRMIKEHKLRHEREASFHRTQAQRLNELTLLNEITVETNVNQDIEIILHRILKKTIEAIGASRGTIVLVDESGKIIQQINIGFSTDDHNLAYYDYFKEKLSAQKKPILFTREEEPCKEFLEKHNCISAFCTPFRDHELMTGYICLLLDERNRTLSEEQQRVLNIIAAQSVRVIENVRLYKAEREKEILQREMSLARDIQSYLLSNKNPSIPNFDIFAHNTPSFAVGGDYFDIMRLDENRFAVAIGDVSGKGVPAALLMAYLQAAVRSLIIEEHSINELVFRINNIIYENTDSSIFITFFIAFITIDSGEIEYVNAGHNHPLVFHRHTNDENRTEMLAAGGPLLGGFENVNYSKGKGKIERDDILLLYTDGVSEAMDGNEEEFGKERIINELQSSNSLTAVQLKDSLLKSVKNFTNNQPQSDDITLMIIKRI